MIKYITALFLLFISLLFSQEKKPKIGLVLSGGGAKGLTYIPILEAIEESGIKIDYISGTSIGAIIGGLYASGYNAKQIDSLVNSINFEKVLLTEKNRKSFVFNDKEKNEKYILEIPFNNFKPIIPSAISKGQGVLDILSKELRHVKYNIEYKNLPTPFLCVGTDLETGKSIELIKGFLPKSILASSSYPLLLKPVVIDSILLADGALVNNYPVEELKKRGIDIIIGVNISGKIKNKKELESANQILNQISYYSSYKKILEQEKLVDIKINPEIQEISVTDFKMKDSIYKIGKIAVEKVKYQLDSIAKIQGLNYKKPPLKVNSLSEKIKINDIKISGNKKFSDEYIIKRINLNKNNKYTYLQISNAINNLYSTGFFDLITFYIDNNPEQEKIIYLDIIENKDDLKAKLSMNYNDIFKTGILVNLSKQNFLIRNSKLSTDIILGDKFRYNIDYFIDKGIIPSFGLTQYFMNYSTEFSNTEQIKSKIFNTRIFLRSTLYEKYAAEIGIEHVYSYYKTNITLPENNNYYILPYFSFKIDTRDDNYFPKDGLKLKLISKYNSFSDQDKFNKYLILNGDLESHFTKNLFTFNTKISVASTIGNVNTILFKNRNGGIFNQELLNFNKFYGYAFDEIRGNHKFNLSTEIQYEFYKKNYISIFANYLNMENKIENISYFKFKYTGYGLSYSYNSPIGPLQLFYSYSPETQKSHLNLNLGYTF